MKWTCVWPVVLLAMVAAACGTDSAPEARSPRGEPRAIVAIEVGGGGAGGVYRAAGTVRSLRRAELGTRMIGRIESVRVRAGDRVRAGQMLATFDRATQAAARRQAAAGLDLAAANLRRIERLYADSAVPLAQLDAARAGFAQAEGQAAAAEAELTYAELVAPFAGLVTARLADPGDLVAPGRPIVVIEDEGLREIVVAAPEPITARLRPGQTVEVEVGTEGRRVVAQVVAVVPAVDPASRTVEIRLGTAERLASNLTAVAFLPVPGVAGEVTIPPGALVERGQLTGVYLFAPDSTVRLRWVRLGRRLPGWIEVASGLKPGDLVAGHPAGIRDGELALPVRQEGMR